MCRVAKGRHEQVRTGALPPHTLRFPQLPLSRLWGATPPAPLMSLTQFRQLCHQQAGGHVPNARHAAQQLVPRTPQRAGLDQETSAASCRRRPAITRAVAVAGDTRLRCCQHPYHCRLRATTPRNSCCVRQQTGGFTASPNRGMPASITSVFANRPVGANPAPAAGTTTAALPRLTLSPTLAPALPSLLTPPPPAPAPLTAPATPLSPLHHSLATPPRPHLHPHPTGLALRRSPVHPYLCHVCPPAILCVVPPAVPALRIRTTRPGELGRRDDPSLPRSA